MAPQFTKEQRIFITQTYIQTGSYQEVQRRWPNRFPGVRVPCKSAIFKSKNKFLQHGTVLNRNKTNSGRPRAARSPANVAAVRTELQNNPRASIRRNNLPHIPRSSFQRIVANDLNWHPYRILKRNSLNPEDPPRRLAFCNWLLNRPQRFLREVVIVDEACFPMNGSVNTANVREYAPRGNPPDNFVYEVPNDRRKVTVFAAVTGNNNLIGPIFCDGNVNGEVYLQIINGTLEPELARIFGRQNNGAIARAWFIQDGAPAHRGIMVRDRLQELFPNRVVGLGHAIEWPPRSPDLTPLDFWLWGDVKSRVYGEAGPPRTIRELRTRIEAAFRAIRRTRVTQHAVRAMEGRARKCVALQGNHVEDRH